MNNIPWVEKYRPTNLDSVVLDDINKQILDNILKFNYFPNLLFHGPPGTGKTTTIINLVQQYQKNNNQENKGLMIHLNASDERGIDTIRSQICQFVGSKGLFSTGMKFIILDEVDYMTKNAQMALRCLLNSTVNTNVRFCLICNYISRIDESLQNDFIRLRFNQLPTDAINTFLRTIVCAENLVYSDSILLSIQDMFKSDIRSMINFIQSYQYLGDKCKIIDENALIILHNKLCDKNVQNKGLYDIIKGYCKQYNIIESAIIKMYFNFLIKNHLHNLTIENISIIERFMHDKSSPPDYLINYFISSWRVE